MRVTLEPTSRIVQIETTHGDQVPGRVWQGHTDGGLEIVAVITRVAANIADDCSELEAALGEVAAPRPAAQAFPARVIL